MRRDPAVVSYNMSRIRGKNTRPEMVLRGALHALGLRYRLHASLPGRPDILFVRPKVAVFVDGGFWHGRDLKKLAGQLHVRKRFWLQKINANVERDRRNAKELKKRGYCVLRFWDDEVLKNPEKCARKVQKTLMRRA